MKPRELKYKPGNLRFGSIIGTGGIGSGKFFILNGNHTLGREESRSGHFLDMNDYCKQHIILHYVKVLLGSAFPVIPLGKIGDDDIGQTLFREMSEAGFVMKWLEIVPGVSTLFSFCFYYPDGNGGNLTTDNSASSLVDPGYIERAFPEIKNPGSGGIIMAAPEVPLVARKKLLELGKQSGFFCSASFTTGEIPFALEHDNIKNIDLIAINIDEASAVAGITAGKTDKLSVVQSAIGKLRLFNKEIMVSVTAGKDGSWCWDAGQLNYFPAIDARPVSTAGAGDAFFSGLLCGIALGLHLFDAQQLASLVAGLSIGSPNAIHKGIDRHSLREFSEASEMIYSDSIIKLLEE